MSLIRERIESYYPVKGEKQSISVKNDVSDSVKQLRQLRSLRRAMYRNAGAVGGNEFNQFINVVDDIRHETTKKAFNEVLGSSDMIRAIRQLAKELGD